MTDGNGTNGFRGAEYDGLSEKELTCTKALHVLKLSSGPDEPEHIFEQIQQETRRKRCWRKAVFIKIGKGPSSVGHPTSVTPNVTMDIPHIAPTVSIPPTWSLQN